MSIFRREADFSISQESRDRYKEWIPQGPQESTDGIVLDSIKNASDIIAERVTSERERRRGWRIVGPRPEKRIAEPDRPRSYVDLAERIGADAVYSSADELSLRPSKKELSAAIAPQVETEELTFNASGEAVETANSNDVASGIALGGLISRLAGRARRKTLSPLTEAVSQISLKEPYGRAKESVRDGYERVRGWMDGGDGSENYLLVTKTSESRSEKVGALAVVAGAIVRGSIKKGLESAPRLKRPDIDVAGYARLASTPLDATINLSSRIYEGARSLAKNEEYHETRRKLAIQAAAGGLALAAAAVSVYAINKTGHGPQSSQEAVNHTPAQHTKLLEFGSLPLPLQVAKVHAIHHAHAVAKHVGYHVEHLKYYGDTIWYHAKANVIAKFPHASQEKIGELTNKYSQLIVRVNHIKDTTHMLLGQHFKMPRLR